jgi:hypothetical protein
MFMPWMSMHLRGAGQVNMLQNVSSPTFPVQVSLACARAVGARIVITIGTAAATPTLRISARREIRRASPG